MDKYLRSCRLQEIDFVTLSNRVVVSHIQLRNQFSMGILRAVSVVSRRRDKSEYALNIADKESES